MHAFSTRLLTASFDREHGEASCYESSDETRASGRSCEGHVLFLYSFVATIPASLMGDDDSRFGLMRSEAIVVSRGGKLARLIGPRQSPIGNQKLRLARGNYPRPRRRLGSNGLSPLRRLNRIGVPGRSKASRRLLVRYST